MNTDKTVKANFNTASSALTLAVDGSGIVAPSVGSHDYTLGANVTIIATAFTNWAFMSWTGNVTDNLSPTTNVTMNTNKTVIANFTRVNSILRRAVSGNGIISVSPVSSNNTYPVGTSVNITATPASGWLFSKWTGDVANTSSASTNVTMGTDKIITAVFTPNPAPPAPPPSVGGGGGGGGGATNDTRITGLMGIISDEGKVAIDVEAQSLDSKLTLNIPYGTIAKNKLGVRLSSITVTTLAEPKAPPAGVIYIGSVYDLGPGGANFNPPIPMTIRYNDSDIPGGLSEDKLYLATWDEAKSAWNRIDFQLDAKNNLVKTNIAHFSQYAILADTRVANFTLSTINVRPSQIRIGESATVSVIVANSGNLTADYQVILKINDAVQQTKAVTLDGSANTTVSFNLVTSKIGTFNVDIGGQQASFNVTGTPASFKVDSLSISPAEVDPGKLVDITVKVTNTGESEGKYVATLNINTHQIESKEITLAGGASQQVTFKAASDTPGKQIIEINGLMGGFIIKGEVPPPSQIPLPAEKTLSAITPAVTTQQGLTTNASPEPGAINKSNTRLIGVIAGGILLVAVCAIYLTWRQKRAKN
jgi:hypothetical protein